MIKKILLFLFISGSLLNLACQQQSLLNLEKNWKIKQGDNASFKNINYDDSTWKNINLPSILSKDIKQQVLWLRNTIIIPQEYRGSDIAIYR